MKRFLYLVSSVWLATVTVAQQRQRLVSPEVSADRKVTFRLWAPRAAEVRLSGDWMGSQRPIGLAKADNGVWSVTVGPLDPNIYTYGFLVDGMRATDPSCGCSLVSAGRFSSSRFVITDKPPRMWESQNQPPGTVHHERFFSKQQQRMRSFLVYTPAGYEASGSRQYPVLVLMPGSPGNEHDWTSGGGFAEVMFDNLIAQGRMVPMIVAIHSSDVLENGSHDENLRLFERIVVDELVPIMKKLYRVEAQPRGWAIAGRSLGGEFAMAVGLRHPELFRSVASLSGSLIPSSFDNHFGRALANPQGIARDYRLIWVGCGSEDSFLAGAKAFAGLLDAARVPHTFRTYSGPHIMPVFRQELADLLPLLFRP
jgi:enterochelin esterase family protein